MSESKLYQFQEWLESKVSAALPEGIEVLCRRKGNVENDYCRSFIYELFDGCYIPEFECYCRWLTSRITSGDRSPWRYPEALFSSEKKRIGDRFYNTPLADLAPDREHCIAALPGTLAELATIADEVIVGSEKILV